MLQCACVFVHSCMCLYTQTYTLSMHDTDARTNHAQAKTRSLKANPSKVACEKATRRLKAILLKASRLGVSTAEVAKLPTAKNFVTRRDHGWKLFIFLCLMFSGGVIVAVICTARKGCSRIEDIVSGFFLKLKILIKIGSSWINK